MYKNNQGQNMLVDTVYSNNSNKSHETKNIIEKTVI